MIISYLHFFTMAVYLYLTVFLLLRNPKALVNRVCAGLMMSLAFWSFAMTFVHNLLISRESAQTFTDLSSIGWASVSSMFLWFVLVFTGNTEILKKKWLYPVLFFLPFSIVWLQYSGILYVISVKLSYGWKTILKNNGWAYYFVYSYFSLMIAGLYFLAGFIRRTRETALKKQAKVMLGVIIVPLLIGTLSDVALPLLEIQSIPNIGNVFSLVWAFGIVYTIVRYRFLDITPATAAEKIISTMYDSLILLTPGGNVVQANKAALELLDYNAAELSGAPLEAILSPGELQKGRLKLALLEGNLENQEAMFKTRMGKEIPVLVSGSVLMDDAGTVAGIVCVAKDITQTRLLQDEIMKSKKMESLGILAGGIAHDFNNLLSVIEGSFSLMEDRIPRNDKLFNWLSWAKDAAGKASELANKFISFSPGGWLEKENIYLELIIEKIKDAGLQGDRSLYRFEVPIGLPAVRGNEEQLIILFRDLLDNAFRAIPPDSGRQGRIVVKGETFDAQLHNPLLLKEGRYIKLTVEDNGVGIPKSIIGRVFDPYFTTRDEFNKKGLGLGLTLCYSIVKKHDGHITIDSNEGKGTVVTVYLPVSEKYS